MTDEVIENDGKVLDEVEEKAPEEKGKTNYWMVAFIIVAVLFVMAVMTNGFDTMTGNDIGKVDAQKQTVDFVNKYFMQGNYSVQSYSVTEQHGIYIVGLSVENQSFNTYVTKDGKLMFPQGFDTTVAPKQGQ